MKNHRNKHSAFLAGMTVLCYCWLKAGQDKIKQINSASCICGQQWNQFVHAENGIQFLSFPLPWSYPSHYFVYGHSLIWTTFITQVHSALALWRKSEQDRFFYCLHLFIIWHNRLSCKKMQRHQSTDSWKKLKWNIFEKMLLFPNVRLHFHH